MTRSELIEKLAQKHPHLLPTDIERVVLTIFDGISNSLATGNRVELRGFGAFSVREREARVGRNPKTGEKVEVDTRHSIMFKAGKELRQRLNKDAPRSAPLVKKTTKEEKRVLEPA